MGYQRGNAAYAYDYEAQERLAPSAPATPRIDVYTGAGRAANQAVSPVFTHVLKVFCALVAVVFVIGLARIALASATTDVLNRGASAYEQLDEARSEGKNLEIMNSVYGSDTRIRSIAVDTLGMVEGDGSVTLDFSEPAASAADAS